jgi:uncharacterized protein YgbK (DUF1537 family)
VDAPQVAIVADDLTGTLDCAGPFATRGVPTWAVVEPRDCTRAELAAAQVVSINCASRHLPAAQAAAAVREAIERLCPPQAPILIKKIDSTLRGNVAAETLAALQASGRANAIVLPAFPAQGRTVRNAVVHVAGVPLAQTSFARDALSPPPLEPLDRVFAEAAPHARVARVASGGPFDLSPRGTGPCVLVVDTETDAELQASVRALRDRLDECVLVGTAGIAGAVAQVCIPAGAAPARPRVAGPMLFVVGSRAEQSAAQVAALRERADVAVFDAPDGVAPFEALARSDAAALVLRATAGARDRPADADTVAGRLAQTSVALLRNRPIGALLATGGDTAVAILRALSRPALQVMGDLLPGIPYCRIDADGRTLWWVTKAGGFGARGTLAEVLDLLRG